jgi:prepilin-type N-terminal cleavage/methylation domain-containing protein
MENKFLKDNKGFSLIEVMTAVALMGSLAYVGVTTTFDVVQDMKNETTKAKLTNDLRMELSQVLRDPNFSNAQADIQDCMNKTNNSCYDSASLNHTRVDEATGKSPRVAGPSDDPVLLTKEGNRDVFNDKGERVPCSAEFASCKVSVTYEVNEFCDWGSHTANSTECGAGNPAQYAQVEVFVHQYSDKFATERDAKGNKIGKNIELFKMSTIIVNSSFALTRGDGKNDVCNSTYTSGLDNSLKQRCTDEKLLTAVKNVALKGPEGPTGHTGAVGPRGDRGAATYCHSKGGGVALSHHQKQALNRLQGPARILGDVGGGNVRVVNRAGHVYTMSKGSIHGWASRGGGCFAEGTQITMADGSKKNIELIKVGDLVWNPLTRKPAKVQKGVKGPEEFKMYSFAMKGETVHVTKTHPMLTQRGIIAAEDVKSDDLMMWKNGALVDIDKIDTYYTEQDVYNLHLVSEDGKNIEGAVIANDVITGDLEMQQQLQNNELPTAKLSH